MSKRRYVTGLRAVEQLLSNRDAEIRRLFAEYRTANPRVEAVIQDARRRGIDVQPANRARLTQMSGAARHQGVVAEVLRTTVLDEAGLRTLVEGRLQKASGAGPLLLILDGIEDPHNLGACMRTAEAAGADAIVVPRHGAAGLTPAVSKVAAGAAEVLPFAPVASLSRVLAWLRDYGVTVIGASGSAEISVYDADLDRPVAIAMGAEHAGLGKSVATRCDTLVHLPMRGRVTSLNVSVATGIILYEALRQRRYGRSATPR